jgi:TfoX/Sxy family transcriptional regulator of competence genes
MKWVKAPEALKKLLEDAMDRIECEKRPMFGYPAYFINRNMFTGLFQDQLFVRLSSKHLETLLKKFPSIRNLEPMPGRPMKDYFVLPRELYTNTRALKDAIRESVEHTRTLAPKVKTPRKKLSKEIAPHPKAPRSKAPKKK